MSENSFFLARFLANMREKTEKWREKSKNAELFGFSRVCGLASEKIPGPLEKYGVNDSEQEASEYHQKTRKFQSALRLETALKNGFSLRLNPFILKGFHGFIFSKIQFFSRVFLANFQKFKKTF